MNMRTLQLKLYGLLATGGTLLAFQGCGLSDQQWASVWQSVITSGLSTIVNVSLASLAAGTV